MVLHDMLIKPVFTVKLRVTVDPLALEDPNLSRLKGTGNR